jgi:hypothetical protein
MTDQEAARGTPPNQKQLAKDLGDRLSLWDGVVAMGSPFGAIWRWAHSEVTGIWTYRCYLPGDRFFIALSLTGDRLEASLNLKPEEWDDVIGEGAEERARIETLRTTAIATGDDPAWIHVPMVTDAELPLLAKLLFARARRIQAPRSKKRRR